MTIKARLSRARVELQKRLACQIPSRFLVPGRVKFPHPVGIVIGDGVSIGQNCQIYQGVTIGLKDHAAKDYPVIGDDVFIYAGACVLGGIRVGDRAVIGAGALVTRDVPSEAVVYGRNQILVKETQTP